MVENNRRRAQLSTLFVQAVGIALAMYFIVKGEYSYSFFTLVFLFVSSLLLQALGAKQRAQDLIIEQQQGRLFGVKVGMFFVIEVAHEGGYEWTTSFNQSQFRLVRTVQSEGRKEFTFEAMQRGRYVIKMICATNTGEQIRQARYTVVVS